MGVGVEPGPTASLPTPTSSARESSAAPEGASTTHTAKASAASFTTPANLRRAKPPRHEIHHPPPTSPFQD